MIPSSIEWKRRLEKLKQIINSRKVDAILITNTDNVCYLTGFTGSSGVVIITIKSAYFLTDSRYKTQAGIEVKGYKIQCYKKKLEGIAALLIKTDVKKIGFEGENLSFDFYQSLRKFVTGRSFVSLSKDIRQLRITKSAEEIVNIRRAIKILDGGFSYIAENITSGIKERDLSLAVEWELKKNGADALSFEIIVASGERSALPHGKPSSKKIRKADLVVVDMGVSLNGLHSDKTRTYAIGKVSKERKRIYDIVKKAQSKAINAIRPGVSASDIDGEARGYIRQEGFGKYFGHGTGHGIGLAVHEPPHISPGSSDVLEEGMVFTVEPGIYVPGLGGVRIEDMVMVTDNGCKVLTARDENELEVI